MVKIIKFLKKANKLIVLSNLLLSKQTTVLSFVCVCEKGKMLVIAL